VHIGGSGFWLQRGSEVAVVVMVDDIVRDTVVDALDVAVEVMVLLRLTDAVLLAV
jgi:hypothetical protein